MMTGLPSMKSRDMPAHLEKVIGTHERVMQGIRERAAEHEKFRADTDQRLNAEMRLKGY